MDIIDIGIITSYVLIALCAIAAIVMPLVQSFSDPKSLTKSAIGIGALAVIFIISYAMADSVGEGVTEVVAKRVGAGIITTYIMFFIAVGGILYTEISKMIK